MDDLKGKKPGEDTRDYAFHSYIYIQNLANSLNSSDDPLVKRALRMIKSFPNNKAIIDRNVNDVKRHLKPKQAARAIHPNPFEPNPDNNAVDGDLRLGNVKYSGANFGLNLHELGEHTLITGRSGAGKTTLIYIMLSQLLEYGIPLWAFDFKQDYRHLARTGKVLVFDWETFRFNPLRPPPNVNPKLWIQAFTNVFCQSYYLLAGSKAILVDELETLYNDYRVFEGSDAYPTLYDLYDSLLARKLERKYGRETDSWESVKTRTKTCLLSFGKMLNCNKGFPIDDLLNKNVVFELEGLISENYTFILSIILRHIFEYRISNNQRSGLKHIFLFDEAKTVYNRQKERDTKIGLPEIAQFTSKIREFGEGLVVADQMPTELADSIKANVYTVICMSQAGGPNVAEMSRAMGLAIEQREACMALKADKDAQVFEAIVKLSSRWHTPFVIHVVPFHVKKDVANEDLKRIMSPILDEMNQRVIPRTEYKLVQSAKQQDEKEREAKERAQRQAAAEEKEEVEGNILIQILTNIREHPFIDQKSRIQMLGLASSSSTTDRYFKEMIAKNFVTVHKIGLGKGLSTKVLYEITEKGAEYAKMDKVEVHGKGDLKHKFWQHTIKEFYKSLGHNAEIEKRFGIKNVDVGFETDGKKTAIEVELTPAHLIENIQRDMEAGCTEIIIAVPNKRNITTYKKKIEYYRKEFLEKIEFKVLTDFLTQQELSHE